MQLDINNIISLQTLQSQSAVLSKHWKPSEALTLTKLKTRLTDKEQLNVLHCITMFMKQQMLCHVLCSNLCIYALKLSGFAIL